MGLMRLGFSLFFHRVLFTKINFQSNVIFTIVFSVLKYQSQRVKRHHSEGFKYPIDLWIALSRHIKPEQIQTFAQICQASNAVVHTVQFWKHLYCR